MTYNDVIKGLECCIKSECSKCPLKRSFCSENVAMEYALDLINRQNTEIEKYKNLYEDLKAENLETIKAIKGCKAEAIKEFAERLKKYKLYYQNPHSPIYADVVEVKAIDNLVKEMTEERK